MKKLILIGLGLICVSANAQESVDPFAELDAEISALEAEGSPEDMAEFQKWKDDYLAEYQKFRVEHFNKLDDIRDKLINTWGQAEVSEQTKFVEYGEENQTKTVFDFENNEIRISVIQDTKTEDNAEVASKQLADLIEKAKQQNSVQKSVLKSLIGSENELSTASEMLKTAEIKEEVVDVNSLPEKIIAEQTKEIALQTERQCQEVEKMYDLMENQKDDSKQAALAADEEKIKAERLKIKQEEKQRIARLKKQAETLVAETNKRDALTNKKIVTYTIPLKNKKDTDRAKPYFSQVKEESKRFELNPSLVFAVIHTESYFNPKAQSHVPAYGLMQIVPTTAGVDVNRFLFDKDAPMSPDNLYVANTNIETGAAYLHILINRYLRKIDDPLSRLFCAIAAYNTGSGNVAKTFNPDGSRNITKAAKIINELTPEQVYKKLLLELPYEETRHYLERVNNRRAIYQFLDEI